LYQEEYLALSPSEFFLRFKETAGLDNPKKVVYVSCRELLENAIDATEVIGVLPEISINISPFDKQNGWYEIRVKDNGVGVRGDLIPDVFGRLMLSSKYQLRQARGLYGLGGKLCLLFGSSETGQPFKVVSSVGDGKIHGYSMRIDVVKNQPIVVNHVIKESKWRGTIVSVVTKGNFKRAFPLIRKYLHGFSLINPYVNLKFVFEDTILQFKHVSIAIPKPPKKIKPHPKSVTRFELTKMMEEHKNISVSDFLPSYFHRVGKKKTDDFLKFAKIKTDEKVFDILHNEVSMNKFYSALHDFNSWIEPNVNCLSILGEQLFLNSVYSRVSPRFASYAVRVGSYSGLPFVVEIVSAFGGKIKTPKSGVFHVHRFANRMPLLTDVKDAINRTVIDGTNFAYFKITKEMPIEFFVHLASIRIPYKSQGKESIADVEEIIKALHLAVIESLKKLSKKVKHREKTLFELKKSKIIAKYLTKTNQFVSDSLKLPKHDLEKLYPKLFKKVD